MIFAILTFGIVSVIMQFVLVRQLQTTFLGNELSLGIILFSWLAGSSLGSFLARPALNRGQKNKERLCLLMLFNCFWAYISLFLSCGLKNMFGLSPYEILQPLEIFLISVINILPFSASLGASFVLASAIINAPVRVYFLEAVGAFLAGLLCLALPLYFNSTQIVFGLSCLILSCAVAVLYKEKGKILRLLFISLLILNFVLQGSGQLKRFHDFTNGLRFKPQKLISSVDSIYGNIAVTRRDTTYSLYENGKLYFSTEDTESMEELSDMALLSHPEPRKILLIGSGISGLTAQLLKFPVDNIDYLELDPALIASGLKYIPDSSGYGLNDPRVKIFNQDARFFIRNTAKRYDLVILSLGDPLSLQLNRFYTAEFFQEVKKVLEAGTGLFCLSLSSKEDILAQEMLKYNASIYKTALSAFNNIGIIPGERMILACSDNPSYLFTPEILEERFVQKRIPTQYFSAYHIRARLSRKEYVRENIEANLNKVEINRDYSPFGFYYCLGLWGKASWLNFAKFWRFLGKIKLTYLLLALFIFLLFLRKKAVKITIFTTGLAGIALEVIISLIFQINFGYLYYRLGLIIGLFMLGLALGSLENIHDIKKKHPPAPGKTLFYLETGIGTLCLFTPFLLRGWEPSYIIVTTLMGFLVGYEFGTFCLIHPAPVVYSLDLAGAAMGGLLVGLVFIPVWGIYKTCLGIALIKVIGLPFLKRQAR